MSSAPNLSLALRQGGAFFLTSTCSGRGKAILPRPVPMRTLFSSRIRGHLWGYCACNVVSLHYVPHQNLDRHRCPSRTLRRYSVPDARKTDSAYLCQRPFRPGVPALSSGAPFPRDVPKGPLTALQRHGNSEPYWRRSGHPAKPLPPSVRLEYGAVQERGAAFQAGNVHLKVRLGRVIVSNRVPGNASTGLRSKLRRLAIF